MIILAIDTSCDDTSIAILKIKDLRFKILSNIVSSQVKLHAKYGGVYPTLAKREHQKNLIPVLIQSLKGAKLLKTKKQNSKLPVVHTQQSKIRNLEKILEREPDLLKNLAKFLKRYEKPEIDLISVTIGPGLEPCLWTGVNFAKALSYFWNLPIIPINHIEAHIFANLLPQIRSKSTTAHFQWAGLPSPYPRAVAKINHSPFSMGWVAQPLSKGCGKNQKSKIKFPAICLVVSGGHTQLILMRGLGKYKILGETRDDAAGECLDKVARILELPYPGGPVIEKLSKTSGTRRAGVKPKTYKIELPRPMISQKNFDFSFSGLKTAVLYRVKGERFKVKDKRYIREMCQEVQQAIIDVLISKTLKAAKKYQAKTIILGGGVAANNELRKQFNYKLKTTRLPAPRAQASGGQVNYKLNFLVPPKNLCTDNAAMVGLTAYFHHLKREDQNWQKILVNANLRI